MHAAESIELVARDAADLIFPYYADGGDPSIYDAKAGVKQAFFNLIGTNPDALNGLIAEAADFTLACVNEMLGDPHHGRFLDRLDWEPLVEPGRADRRMRIQADFRYRDPKGRIWTAPKGRIVDGASVPRALWWFADPFIGDYRRATALHDIYCEDRTMSSKDVHLMFLSAALCAGAGSLKAKTMYRGILVGGPDWVVRNEG